MDNKIKPIDIIADELSKKTIELSHYKVAYDELYSENAKLKKLEELVNSDSELKDLLDKKIKVKEEQ